MGKGGAELNVAVEAAGPSGPIPADDAVVALNGSRITAKLDRVLAVLDGPETSLGEARQSLEEAFARGGPADTIIAGDEEHYLARVLNQVSKLESSAHHVAVAVALIRGNEAVLGCIGGADAELVGHDGEFIDQPHHDARSERFPSVWRSELSTHDAVVLLGQAVAEHVDGVELRQTIHASYALRNAAEWLVTLAAGRSRTRATALVARLEPGRSKSPARPSEPVGTRQPVQESEAPKAAVAVINARRELEPPKRAGRPRLRTAGVGAVALAALIAAMAFVGPAMRAHLSATELSAPTGLKPFGVTPHDAFLTWSVPPGASAYQLRIDGRAFSSRAPQIHVSNILTPGRSYRWRIRAIFRSQKGPWSAWARVTIPLAPALPAPRLTSPFGDLPASEAKSVPFCWVGSRSSQSFNLRLSGDHKRFNSSPHRSALKPALHNASALCLTRSLPIGYRYSWQLGAVAKDRQEAWTAWNHFFISKPPAPTPTPTAFVSSGPTLPSTPTTSTSTTGSTGSSGSTGTGTGTGTGSSTGTTGSAGASGSTGASGSSGSSSSSGTTGSSGSSQSGSSSVQVCANPPNC